jgi:hypothetical protein
MAFDNNPEIAGPGAASIEAIPDGTGFSGDDTQWKKEPPAPAVESEEPEFDPNFPFGKPADIDWTKIDTPGSILLKELNLRSWMQSTEYCSGHPLDRPADESSELYPYVTGENVYVEIAKLDMAYTRGVISDVYFRHRKRELREIGGTRFFLNVNVYNQTIFQDWVRMLGTMVMMSLGGAINPLVVRYNPLRPGTNYSIYLDYWTLDERDIIHALVLSSLAQFPV